MDVFASASVGLRRVIALYICQRNRRRWGVDSRLFIDEKLIDVVVSRGESQIYVQNKYSEVIALAYLNE